MFGHDDNQNQNQDHNAPITGAPAPEPTDQSAATPPGLTINNNPVPSVVSPGISTDSPTSTEAPASGDLLEIKQEALQHLSPLVGQLDQSPEEKFRTTMMMIQASDDQKLVKEAFECAKKITDDKARAQALLDVINEINYFTQQKK